MSGELARFPRAAAVAALAWMTGLLSPCAAAGPDQVTPPAATTNISAGLANATDLLQFLDGSSLHGTLQTITPEQGIGWEHPDARQLIRFKPTNLASIRFENPKPVTLPGAPSCRFRFRNGDESFGQLTSIDQESVRLTSWFGGELSTRCDALESVTFLSKGYSITYEGPNSAEGWVQGKTPHAWQYRDGAFIASAAGTLGRDLNLSGSSSVSFDLAWNGQFSLVVALYTKVLDRFDYNSNSYMFYFNPGYASLHRIHGGPMNLGQVQIPEMIQKSKFHVEIRTSRDDSSLALLVDDRLVQRWKDTAGFIGQGSGIVFFAQIDGPSVKISNLKAAKWEGDSGIDTLTNAPTTEDLICLVNRDRVSGRLEAMRDGSVRITAGETPLDIPVSRISQIWLRSALTKATPSAPWTVRAYFAGGGAVTFELTAWNQHRVSGNSPSFGKIEFDPVSIRQLQFNLARIKPDAEGMEVLDGDIWEDQ